MAAAATLIVGAAGRDPSAPLVRIASAVSLPLLVLGFAPAMMQRQLEPALIVSYSLLILAIAFACGWWLKETAYYVCGGFLAACEALAGGTFVTTVIYHRLGAEASLALFGGAACFVLGAVISALKGGWLKPPAGDNPADAPDPSPPILPAVSLTPPLSPPAS